MDIHKDIKRVRMMTYFVEATEELLREEDIDGISIRKIAQKAGYNSATIYNYFDDLEHLLLFSSVHYLHQYTTELARNIDSDMPALEKSRIIYKTFNSFAFRSPEIFYNMFFGKYSRRLTQVIKEYYELFPDDLEQQSGYVKQMLMQGNVYERDREIVKDLVRGGNVSEEKADFVIELLVRTQQSYLYEILINQDRINPDEHNEKFLKLFDSITEISKP